MFSKSLGSYEILDKLGSGSFGSVYKARHKKNLQTYALKVIEIGRLISNNIPIPIEYIEREVTVLKKLSHPNIVGLTEYVVDGDQHILAMEYCGGPTLDQFRLKHKLNEEGVRNLFSQLAAGLKYMWAKNIIHRDLKPQNILFTSDRADAQLKIIDFGFSQIRHPANLMTSVVGTPIYMAPEILQNRPYSGKSDLWSVGCILYEVLVGVSPFAHATSHMDLARLHMSWAGPVLPEALRVSPACLDLLSKLLQPDPVLRIDWNEFFTHPFISNPETFAESRIPVQIAPMCRSVILNTQDLDPACLVSVMKAHLLSDGSADAEKYDGVAALLETKDGQQIEMLDHQPMSVYKDQLIGASVLYLVLPLNKRKETIDDTAYEVLSAIVAKDTVSTLGSPSKTTSTTQITNEPTEMATLHSDFMELAEQLRENVRSCRELYETCRVYLECRDIQVGALKASLKMLEKHRNELCDLSVSFKKMYKEPMEIAIKSLPSKVEKSIELLRKTIVDNSGLPMLQGKSLLECVGEANIRAALRACIDTITESGRLVDSCDASLENSHMGSKALECIQHELHHTKRDWEAMRAKLQTVENSQDAVEAWVSKVDEHLCGATSWLGFSFEDPIREGLEQSRVHAATAQEAAREVRRLAQSIVASKEMWPVLVGEFCTVANTRVQVFSAFRSLHVCGTQSYEPLKREIEDLENLPELINKFKDQAAQVLFARHAFEKRVQMETRTADENVQKMRTSMIDVMRSFHNKFEKHPLAKGFVTAVDALAPADVRISMNAPDTTHVHSALMAAQTQNAQLRSELHAFASEVSALREHTRQLSLQLNQARGKEWENAETIRLLQEQLRFMHMRR
jgi:serine/threonine-protein kinase ULK/ATG1